MSSTRRPVVPKTLQLRAENPGQRISDVPHVNTTDYELSESVVLPPALQLKAEAAQASDNDLPTTRIMMDDDARALFRHRLILCCAIAAGPFLFLAICAATNFIELFGRDTVGWTGLGLAIVTILILLGTGAGLYRDRNVPETWLRVAEIVTFGTMALLVAYWQFCVLTETPVMGFEGYRHEQTSVLAATLIVHFLWFVLIVFHGVLVPNTPMRGVGITLALAFGAIAISVVAAFVHPPTARNAGPVFAIAGMILVAGSGLAIFGTAKMEALRQEVLSAKEAIRELGQYRLRRKLGHGGMGEVFLAEHRLLKRPCALKRIHPRYLNNPDQLRRFEREVQATAKLRHPNTVEIYDYGRADDGTFYYVMEYLNGLSLEDLIGAHGPQSPDRVIHIMRQVCGALREAHRLGMVHRDIKPSNILLFPDGAQYDQVKVVDFGLVHSLADELDPNSKITRDGLIVGTPEYMSPEQASGSTLDGRSDIFSLGSVAYFLLTGREGFHRDNPMKTLLAIVNEQPVPIVNVNPHIPTDLVSIVGKCLAKTPNERYMTAADLEHALAESSRADAWTEDRATDWWTLHPSAQPGTGTDLESLPLPAEVG
jgi:eukaryotic-like serine/threonine-protein kinase